MRLQRVRMEKANQPPESGRNNSVMWIVQLALRRPYTFIVAGLLLLIVSPLVILRTPTDIFPNINIPVVSIVWQYTGMLPTEFAGRITSVYERALTTTVNDIEHIESQSFNGVWVIKVFFQPSAKIEAALAQVTAIAQTITRQTPAGVTPPLVITYNASSVPILQLGLSGEGLSEQQLNDFTMNNIRTLLATVPGASIPWPYGGKVRQITIALDLQKLNGLGDLITTGTDSTPDNAKALFRLARTDILRVFIDVPQADSPAVSKGTKAYLQLQEFPGEKFEGRITNIFRGDRSGYPYAPYRGAGAQCGRAALPRRLCPDSSHSPGQATMVVPSNALLFRSNGR